MADNARIEINGIEFTNFETVSVEKTLEGFNGGFRFTGSAAKTYNIKNGSACRIFINNISMINGYIDNIGPSINPDDHSIDFSGRDRTVDVSDSSLPQNINFSGGTTLSQIIRSVLDNLGLTSIGVINNVSGLEAFTKEELVDSKPDQNALDFITQYAQKRSVLITTDGNGNIVITRTGTQRISDKLINLYSDPARRNNVLSASSANKLNERYNKITIISQDNLAASGASFGLNSVSVSGSAFDSEIRSSRQLTVQSKNASTSAECAEIAAFQVNVRRAQALDYNAAVNGFKLDNGGIWEINKLVQVQDEPNGISSELLANSITYNYANGSGAKTSMNFVAKDAYSLQAELDRREARQNKTELFTF